MYTPKNILLSIKCAVFYTLNLQEGKTWSLKTNINMICQIYFNIFILPTFFFQIPSPANTFTHYPLVTTWVLTNSFMYNIIYITFNMTAPILHCTYNAHSLTHSNTHTHTRKNKQQWPNNTPIHIQSGHNTLRLVICCLDTNTCPALLRGPHQGVPRRGS